MAAEAKAPESSRARFLDAAAREFIEQGYESATIRSIAARAGTSLASLTRNWTGKRHLYQHVFEHHVGAINAAQMAGFARWQALPDGRLDQLIEALFRPVLALRGSEGAGAIGHRVYCQALSTHSLEAREIVRPLMAEVRGEMIRLLGTCLPHFSRQQLFLAMNIVNGTYLYTQLHGDRLADNMAIDREAVDWEQASAQLARMVADGISGMQAAGGQ